MTLKWHKQKALSVRHFRKQRGFNVDELDDSAEHTFVVEFITEDDKFIITEDGSNAILLNLI